MASGICGGGGRVEDGGERVGEPLPRGAVVRAVGGDAAEAVHGVGAEVGGDLHGPDEQPGAGGPRVRVGVEERGSVLAARVEDVAGARLDGDAEAVPVEDARHLPGAGGQVGDQGVQVHVVEGEADAVVAQVGEDREGVLQAEVGQAVRAVSPADAHVTLTFGAMRCASGARAAVIRAVPGACGPGREGGLEGDHGADAAAHRPLGQGRRGVEGGVEVGAGRGGRVGGGQGGGGGTRQAGGGCYPCGLPGVVGRAR